VQACFNLANALPNPLRFLRELAALEAVLLAIVEVLNRFLRQRFFAQIMLGDLRLCV
jgi:hypothetical protein